MSQEKEAQKKFYKTREDKEIEEVIALENKVKVLDDIVYKSGQSVKTINMLNRNCKTSFVKPEFLKKAQSVNSRLYDIDLFIQNTIEGNFSPKIRAILADLEKFQLCLKEEMIDDLRYFNSLEHEVDSLKSQLETQKTQFWNEIDRLSKEYYYADHMNAILGVIQPLMNSLTYNPIVVSISTYEPKRIVNQSVATPLKRTVAAESTNQKPRSTIRKQYDQISNTFKWWYSKITPPGYKWKPKSSTVNVKANTGMLLGIKPRTTNISKPTTLRKSIVSNAPSFSNSFAARRYHFVHRRLWVLKAHDRKSQAFK
ncbi:hypothetical protein Tco_0935249 [Tanacetum coccineum]